MSLVVVAPGKLLLTGSYAVLHGAPAIVCAVDRHVAAGLPSARPPPAEVLAAFEGDAAPAVDVSATLRDGQKLGLGGSAAAVVAALGYREAANGQDLASPAVRARILRDARAAHGRVQPGGSGVDVAASVYGGVLRYRVDSRGQASIAPVALPKGLVVDAYWSGRSARTSEMRARVDAFGARDAAAFAARMRELVAAALAAEASALAGDASAFVVAAAACQHGLFALGRDAEAPIVLSGAEHLAALAEQESAAFTPSGAGGGDVFVRLGLAPASERFEAAARRDGFSHVDVHVDPVGVRIHLGPVRVAPLALVESSDDRQGKLSA